ncbi:MAG: hypothetical protein AAGH15_23590, partial [Myxococcota bacterium]
VYATAGGGARRLATLETQRTLSEALEQDLAWADGEWLVARPDGVAAFDAGSGDPRPAPSFAGQVLELSELNADGVGYAVTANTTGMVAYDLESAGWVVIAR